ncbi:MAG: 23S rRNA (uracil(1939)-C(5))-methyltransferase RlmD [Coriobacteriales bacterium]|jgi:23S rRNA (uracil1939-C5)-methyltransferase
MGYKTYNCPASGKCGGCEWLNVPYPIQLKRKEDDIADVFDDIAPNSLMYPIIGMDKPLHCRNKIIVPFAPGRNGTIRYGLYARGSHRIVQRPDCLVENQAATPILQTIASLAKSFKLRAYDEDRGTGFLRYVLIRVSRATGEVLVCLVCTGEQFRSSKAFVRELRKAHPEISTVIMNINKRATNVVLGEREHVLWGKGWISEELCGCRFRISASSFFQVNPIQTEKLYASAIEMADLGKDDTVLDAYCGTGTIGIIASKRAGRVVGVESNATAIRDAKSNARANGMENIDFHTDDAGDFMTECAKDGASFDVVFLDPPRSGCDEKFLGALEKMRPERIVYISCNPKTQARDAENLIRNGYHIEKIQPVDMFPHTSHCENICIFDRK